MVCGWSDVTGGSSSKTGDSGSSVGDLDVRFSGESSGDSGPNVGFVGPEWVRAGGRYTLRTTE
ncbi:hypothetical protein GCM10012279_47940 [Micromonospora yangpuensis]|nr:hypothetical protein GCM10012279_47940 [Micromonospora yangpuensis]